jgi:excisionase family DNA binding protein
MTDVFTGTPQVFTPAEKHGSDNDLFACLADVLTRPRRNPRVPLPEKLFLTISEASEVSGLPQAYLLRQIRDGKLPTIKTGGHRIRRTDLEKL